MVKLFMSLLATKIQIIIGFNNSETDKVKNSALTWLW